MNGALLCPDDFQGRNPLDMKPVKVPWHSLVGGEHVEEPWPGNPLGLNVRVPTPVRKGDAYRSGTHYQSKFDPTLAPTGSTLGLDGSTVPGIANITGKQKRAVPKKAAGSFGKTLGSYKADASKFLLSHEKHPPLAFPVRFHYPDEVRFLSACMNHLVCKPSTMADRF